jgi:hypothetical protein
MRAGTLLAGNIENLVRGFRRSFPDLLYTIKDIVAEDDTVAIYAGPLDWRQYRSESQGRAAYGQAGGERGILVFQDLRWHDRDAGRHNRSDGDIGTARPGADARPAR